MKTSSEATSPALVHVVGGLDHDERSDVEQTDKQAMRRFLSEPDSLYTWLGFESYYASVEPAFTHGHSSQLPTKTPGSVTTTSSSVSFKTAKSTCSNPGLGLHIRTVEAIPEETTLPNTSGSLNLLGSTYQRMLGEMDLLQPFAKELNWSGRGQHATFLLNEDVPLKVLSHLGASAFARVEKVLCRRIALARKTMRCTRGWKISDALREVRHLQDLRHFHIVQLVGTYLQGRDFSILMYPAANCHLGIFLEDTADMWGRLIEQTSGTESEAAEYIHRVNSLVQSLLCLATATKFVHDHTTKHLDIKPRNILVRRVPDRSSGYYTLWRFYLSDFGLSRSFASESQSQSDGPTARTPTYCAPEVYEQESHGRSSDIFSLGCVFAEIFTVLAARHPHEFAEHRRGEDGDECFHKNLDKVVLWVTTARCEPLRHLFSYGSGWISDVICQMLRRDPSERPTAASMLQYLRREWSAQLLESDTCCRRDPEPYVAYEEAQP